MLLTRSIKQAMVNVTCGGAPAYIWPGGGITLMVDVARMPDNSFGTVPTPPDGLAPATVLRRIHDRAAELVEAQYRCWHQQLVPAPGHEIAGVAGEELRIALVDDPIAVVLGEARAHLAEGRAALAEHPDMLHAGFVHDAEKEVAEASITLALVTGRGFPDPADEAG